MAQAQAMQNEDRERRSLQDAAQEERIRRLEAMLDQQVSLTATATNEGQTTQARLMTESTLETPRIEPIYRLKARLPDLVLFGGNTND